MVYGMADLISKPAWRYTIESTPEFLLISAAKMTPFWDPNFTLPCGQLAAPYFYAHGESRPDSKLYTQMEALDPVSYPLSYWPCPGSASHA